MSTYTINWCSPLHLLGLVLITTEEVFDTLAQPIADAFCEAEYERAVRRMYNE